MKAAEQVKQGAAPALTAKAILDIAVIDEIGALDAEIAPLKPKIKRLEALRKEVQGWPERDGLGAGEAVPYFGRLYSLIIGPRENQRKITSMEKVCKAVGKMAFFARCGFSLGAFDECVPASRQGDLVETSRTGPRSVAVIAKGA